MGVDNHVMVDTNSSHNPITTTTTTSIITNKEDVTNVKTDPSLYYPVMSISDGPRSLVKKPIFVSKGSEMQVDIKPGINYVNVDSETPTTTDYKITETATSKDQEYISCIEDLEGKEESSNSNAVDVEWHSDQMWHRRLFKTIMDEKKQRTQEILLINKEKELIAQERRNLELEKKQLDYERRNLEARFAEVDKYRDILPSAKQLHEMGVDLVGVLIWIEVIRDKATSQGIDEKAAVALIVQELKLYNQFNSLEKAIQKHQQDLEVLNIAVEQTQEAYRSLVNLRSKGISDTEIIELNKLIDSWSAGGGWRLDDKLNLTSHH